MAYSAKDGRQEILDTLAGAADEMALAIACLGEAYELLDEQSADRLEQELFRPLQHAYGRAKRTHSQFAARVGLAVRVFEPRSPGIVSHDPRAIIETAVGAISDADVSLAALQDSMLPVDVGDVELRAGLTESRELIGRLPSRSRDLIRMLGR